MDWQKPSNKSDSISKAGINLRIYKHKFNKNAHTRRLVCPLSVKGSGGKPNYNEYVSWWLNLVIRKQRWQEGSLRCRENTTYLHLSEHPQLWVLKGNWVQSSIPWQFVLPTPNLKDQTLCILLPALKSTSSWSQSNPGQHHLSLKPLQLTSLYCLHSPLIQSLTGS